MPLIWVHLICVDKLFKNFRILIFTQVMGNKIHCYVVDDEYGARITNIQMYDSIRLV